MGVAKPQRSQSPRAQGTKADSLPPPQPDHRCHNQSQDYTLIAQAVAEILKPTIREAVEQAIHSSLHSIREDLNTHDKRIEEAEQRIGTLEEELMEAHSLSTKSENRIQLLLDKVDDLENRSRKNNLHIVGVPESVKAEELHRLCEEAISQALGLNKRVSVE